MPGYEERALNRPRFAVLLAALAATAAACSSQEPTTQLTLHVDGPIARTVRPPCLFALRAAVREGGTQRTCLTAIEGFPSPGTTMHSKGVMTFALPRGAVVARVRITQRFAAGGANARQTVDGAIVRGRGEFAGARGSVTGGGGLIDTRTTIRAIRLVYRLRIVR